MSGYSIPTDDFANLSAQIRELQASVRDLNRPRPFTIPILAADPPTTDPTNMWLMPDGRIRARHLNPTGTAFVTREWVPTTPGSGSSGTAPAPPTTAPTTHQKEYQAIWSQSYREGGAQRTDDGATRMYYGYVDSFNGRNRSLAGFDYATIAADLANSTILNVWLRMANEHSYYIAGSDLHLGIHNFTSKPGTWAGGGLLWSMAQTVHYKRNDVHTEGVLFQFASTIRDGSGKGLAIESPSNSAQFYGKVAGVGSGLQPPVLIVSYAK